MERNEKIFLLSKLCDLLVVHKCLFERGLCHFLVVLRDSDIVSFDDYLRYLEVLRLFEPVERYTTFYWFRCGDFDSRLEYLIDQITILKNGNSN